MLKQDFLKLINEFENELIPLIQNYLIFNENKIFLFKDLVPEDCEFVIDIFSKYLCGVRDLRDFYNWADVKHNWTTELPFISHRTWKEFLIFYKEKNKHHHLIFHMLRDVEKNFYSNYLKLGIS